MASAAAQERLIVALDVPTADEAERLVGDLEGVVSFFKVGLLLLLSGGMPRLMERLSREKKVFVDLKLPDDIPETIRSVAAVTADHGVRFLTLSASVTPDTIAAARAGRGDRAHPELLFVPMLSSQDRRSDPSTAGYSEEQFNELIMSKARDGLAAGCDGLIVSGGAIRSLREKFPRVSIVSPGIRLAGSGSDDHRRSATPSAAITMGADYLVVGRPIRNAPDRNARRAVAQAIICEIDRALKARSE